eukprot:CAMPEP_0172300736 /NCGR_PEP_ID=MMETSP1058-20130122/2764_1 /TAXON_ID=83371 /ORGANISM="Detonula confervacea, Strain CCMP 353" /LENGTH=145 /DNA_ID=CAMNT_0013010613 /DNA_START=110 /DNA_END=547 /DNA_ORIENTATION=-
MGLSRRSKARSLLGSEFDLGIVKDDRWTDDDWLVGVWNEKGRVGKSSISIFLVGTSELYGLFLRVKSAACLLLIWAGSSFVSMTLESFVPRIEELLGKKSGILIYLPSKVAECLRPRGVGGQLRGCSELIGLGELNDSYMVAGRC